MENRNEGIRGNKDCSVFVCDWEKRALLEIAGVAGRRAPGRGKAGGKAYGGGNSSTFLW